MTDVLERLQRALPQASQWIDQLLVDHAPTAAPVSGLGFVRLAAWFPASLLAGTKTVLVSKVPFPPVSAYGLPEFEAMARMPMAGITFRGMYFVHKSCNLESVHFHELVHIIQWRVLGFDEFLLTYGAGVLQHGYAGSPLEAMAFELQTQFDRGGAGLPGMADLVTTGALRARDSAAAAFRALGLSIERPGR
jgi:hypothetical protein